MRHALNAILQFAAAHGELDPHDVLDLLHLPEASREYDFETLLDLKANLRDWLAEVEDREERGGLDEVTGRCWRMALLNALRDINSIQEQERAREYDAVRDAVEAGNADAQAAAEVEADRLADAAAEYWATDGDGLTLAEYNDHQYALERNPEGDAL